MTKEEVIHAIESGVIQQAVNHTRARIEDGVDWDYWTARAQQYTSSSGSRFVVAEFSDGHYHGYIDPRDVAPPDGWEGKP